MDPGERTVGVPAWSWRVNSRAGKALEDYAACDSFYISIEGNDAYGPYDENLLQRVPKDVFMGIDELEVGMHFLAETDPGQVPVKITDIDGDYVVVDGNSVLGSQNLNFYVDVVAVRAATEEELASGHVNGEYCHVRDHKGSGCGGH